MMDDITGAPTLHPRCAHRHHLTHTGHSRASAQKARVTSAGCVGRGGGRVRPGGRGCGWWRVGMAQLGGQRGGRGALRLFCLRAGRAWGCSAGAKPRRQEEEEEEEMSGPMSPSGGESGVATVSMTHSAETQAFGSAARLCGEELAIRASQDVFITPAVPCAHVVARRGRWRGLPFGGTSVFFPPASSCPLRAARAGVGRPARVGRCNCACTCSFGPN